MIISIIIILAIIIIDRLVKMWALVSLSQIETMPVWEDVFHLTYVENTGAAFSILREHTWILIVLTVIFCFFLLYYIFFKKMSKWERITLSMVAAGGLGNLYDRIAYNYVIDMFDARIINFAVFNVADIFITCGGIAFMIIFLINDIKRNRELKNDSASDNNGTV